MSNSNDFWKTPPKPTQTRRKYDKIGFIPLGVAGVDKLMSGATGQAQKEFYKVLNFSNFAKHVAWRTAHYFNMTASAKNNLEDYVRFMDETGVTVSFQMIQKQNGKTEEIFFTPSPSFGHALSGAQVCSSLTLSSLSKLFNEDKSPSKNAIFTMVEPNPIPWKISPDQPSWGFTPDREDVEFYNNLISASLNPDVGIDNFIKPTGLAGDAQDSIIGTRLYAQNRGVSVPYSKTYTKDGHFYARRTNEQTSFYKFDTFAASSLEDYVEQTYQGSFAVHGRSIFNEEHTGRRIAKAKDKSFLSFAEKRAFAYFFKASDEDIKNNYNFLSVELPTLIPEKRTVFAIDVDKLPVEGDVDLLRDQQGAIEHIRELLPEALQSCKMVIMLSSSYGMESLKSDPSLFKIADEQKTLSFRLWLQADQPIYADEFHKLLRHHERGLSADGSIYSSNQPIYGDPAFEGCSDPFEDRRRIYVPGEETFDVEMWREEVEELDAAYEAEIKASGGTVTSLTSQRVGGLRLTYDESMTGIEKSQVLTVEKLKGLGDRNMLQRTTGDSFHFGALRNIVNGHLNAVYDEYPYLPPLTTRDLSVTQRDDILTDEVSFLCGAIAEGFLHAYSNPQNIIDDSYLRDYGIERTGAIDPSGKIGGLIIAANDKIAKDRFNEYTSLKGSILRSAKMNTPLDREVAQRFMDRYTGAIFVGGRGHIMTPDLFTGDPILKTPNGLYFTEEGFEETEHRFATFTGDNKFFFAPVQSEKNIPDFWEEGSVDNIIENLKNPNRVQNYAYVSNCSLDEVLSQLPKRKHQIPLGQKMTAAKKEQMPFSKPLDRKTAFEKVYRSSEKHMPDPKRTKNPFTSTSSKMKGIPF